MIGFFVDGNITGDPRVKPVGEWTVLEFSVANNDDRRKEGDEWKTHPVFIDLTYWTKNPTPWINKIVKGAFCSCAGRIKEDRWQDKETGKDRSKHVYVIDGCPTIRAKGGASQSSGTGTAPANQGTSADDEPPPF